MIISCNPNHQPDSNTPADDTAARVGPIRKSDVSKYYTTQDSIVIPITYGDTLTYSKEEFNEIADTHPELLDDNPMPPDITYYTYANKQPFGSEAGQDNYYVLYAYFLSQKNGIDTYAPERKRLIEIYSYINSLFSHFQYGGTYFTHQYSRIMGYAEYSVYLLPKAGDYIEKTYDITKQKTLYITSLRQLIEDERKIDNNMTGKEKAERYKELNQIVDQLDHLITGNFYLRRAQEFHYAHYEYYWLLFALTIR